ncbi:hypothetical protein BHE74_00025111, partial [Ensete ventricosum]
FYANNSGRRSRHHGYSLDLPPALLQSHLFLHRMTEGTHHLQGPSFLSPLPLLTVLSTRACRWEHHQKEQLRLSAVVVKEFDTRQRASLICRDAAPDPELDQFMEAYHDTLVKYEEELSRPLQEAMAFLRRVESQLNAISVDGGSLPITSFILMGKSSEIKALLGRRGSQRRNKCNGDHLEEFMRT